MFCAWWELPARDAVGISRPGVSEDILVPAGAGCVLVKEH